MVKHHYHRELSLFFYKTTSCVDPSYHIDNGNLFDMLICDMFRVNIGLSRPQNGVDASFWRLSFLSISHATQGFVFNFL
jgi:hypothetical protein